MMAAISVVQQARKTRRFEFNETNVTCTFVESFSDVAKIRIQTVMIRENELESFSPWSRCND